MKKFLLLTAMTLFLSQCGGASGTGGGDDTGDDTEEAVAENGGSAISGLFGGSEEDGSISAVANVEDVHEESFSNCDETDNSVDPVLIVQDGVYGAGDASLAGTHGADAITVTLDDFCANGGEFSGYVLEDPVEFDCGLFMVGGEGIWIFDGSATTVHGTFVMATSADQAGTTYVCSGEISGDEDVGGMDCVDESGVAADMGETESCMPLE